MHKRHTFEITHTTVVVRVDINRQNAPSNKKRGGMLLARIELAISRLLSGRLNHLATKANLRSQSQK